MVNRGCSSSEEGQAAGLKKRRERAKRKCVSGITGERRGQGEKENRREGKGGKEKEGKIRETKELRHLLIVRCLRQINLCKFNENNVKVFKRIYEGIYEMDRVLFL